MFLKKKVYKKVKKHIKRKKKKITISKFKFKIDGKGSIGKQNQF